MSDRRQGTIFILLSAIFYSTLAILCKYIYLTGIEMSLVILIRFLATVILLGLFLLVTRREPFLTFSPAVLVQGFFFVAAAIIFFMSIKYLSAGLTSVVFFSHPALVAILAVIFYHEKIGTGQLIGLILALLGLFCISGLFVEKSMHLSPLGLFLAILSAVIYGFYVLLGQKAIKSDGVWTITFTVSLMGLIMTALIFPQNISGLFTLTPYQAFLGFAMAFLGTILPIVLFLKGVGKIGSSIGSLVSIAEVPCTLILAFITLGEVMTPMQIAGTVLIIFATSAAIYR